MTALLLVYAIGGLAVLGLIAWSDPNLREQGGGDVAAVVVLWPICAAVAIVGLILFVIGRLLDPSH